MATQLTVRGVDDTLRAALEAEARARGLSLNRVIVMLLRQATGASEGGRNRPMVYHDLDALAGTWSEADAAEFNRSLAEQRTIDEALWP